MSVNHSETISLSYQLYSGLGEAPTSIQNPTLRTLWDIFSKIKEGSDLSQSELHFLEESSKFTPSTTQWFSSFIWIPSDEGSVKEIHQLSNQILGRQISGKKTLEQADSTLRSKTNPTGREIASLSCLIHSCHARQGSFKTAFEHFSSTKKKAVTRGELIDFIADFNEKTLPKPVLAGAFVAKVTIRNEFSGTREVEVRYDAEGLLEIVDGAISPMDITCRQKLTTSQVEQMHTLYKTLISHIYYNNLGELLEFINFFRKSIQENPGLTLKDAFALYHPPLAAIFDKYQSGTCILLASKFCEELAKIGIHADKVGKTARNVWTTFPIPGTEDNPIKWCNFSEKIRNVDHTDTVCHFMGKDGKTTVIQFACSIEENDPQEIQQYRDQVHNGKTTSAMENYLASRGIDSGSEVRPNKLNDPSTIGKSRLLGRFKAVMIKGKMILGIDFLRSNFYINPSWAKTLPGLPLNANGMASIELKNLSTPDALGIYYINGKQVEISHRNALKIILDKASSEMVIPATMEGDLITLAQSCDALFDEIFISPLPFVRTFYKELTIVGKKMKEFDKIINDPQIDRSTKKQLTVLIDMWDQVIDQLIDQDFSRAAELLIDLKSRLESLN